MEDAALSIRQVGFEAMQTITAMNRTIFGEKRVINRFDRMDLIMLIAYEEQQAVGFKIGYGMNRSMYYSAKGGVLEEFRRKGVAGRLLDRLMADAAGLGYKSFCFDTFPNQHTGMTLLALQRGFHVSEIRYSDVYDDLRLRFVADLGNDRILLGRGRTGRAEDER